MYLQEHFPSLLILTNASETVFYSVQEDSVTELYSFRERPETYSDREGLFGTKGRGDLSAGEPDVVNARMDRYTHRHMKAVRDMVKEVVEPTSYRHVVVAVPPEHKNILKSEVGEHLKDHDVHFIYGNYVRELNPHHLRGIVDRALKPGEE